MTIIEPEAIAYKGCNGEGELIEMMFAVLIAIAVVFITVMVHFTMLRAISVTLLRGRLRPPLRVGLAVYLVLLAHFIEVIVFSVGYYVAIEYAHIGTLKGEFGGNFQEYIYFSLVSYTSLGLGDVYPYGAVRLLTGIEALTGLLMIGWSASFTYFCMVKLWKDD
ncbi:MAG: ion channel [Alphaproteobacteria bacterium]